VTRADAVVLILSLLLIAGLAQAQWRHPDAAAWVEVRAGTTLVGRYPLDQDQAIDVSGPLGHSHIEVAGGRVRFVDSPCINKVCVHSGWLRRSGDGAACLPNRVSIILGGSAAAIDAVSE